MAPTVAPFLSVVSTPARRARYFAWSAHQDARAGLGCRLLYEFVRRVIESAAAIAHAGVLCPEHTSIRVAVAPVDLDAGAIAHDKKSSSNSTPPPEQRCVLPECFDENEVVNVFTLDNLTGSHP